MEFNGYLEPLLWLPHSECSEVVAIVRLVGPLCDEVFKGCDRLRDRLGIAPFLLKHSFNFTTTPHESVREPCDVIEQAEVVFDFSWLHQLACGLRERDVERGRATSDSTDDVTRKSEQLSTCFGLKTLAHGGVS